MTQVQIARQNLDLALAAEAHAQEFEPTLVKAARDRVGLMVERVFTADRIARGCHGCSDR